jgi:hypothetical protein
MLDVSFVLRTALPMNAALVPMLMDTALYANAFVFREANPQLLARLRWTRDCGVRRFDSVRRNVDTVALERLSDAEIWRAPPHWPGACKLAD